MNEHIRRRVERAIERAYGKTLSQVRGLPEAAIGPALRPHNQTLIRLGEMDTAPRSRRDPEEGE